MCVGRFSFGFSEDLLPTLIVTLYPVDQSHTPDANSELDSRLLAATAGTRGEGPTERCFRLRVRAHSAVTRGGSLECIALREQVLRYLLAKTRSDRSVAAEHVRKKDSHTSVGVVCIGRPRTNTQTVD